MVLWLSSMLRFLPDNQLKGHYLALLQSVDWPGIELTPRRLRVGSDAHLLITPHVGEFDFAAIIRRSLLYEPEVFAQVERIIGDVDAVLDIGANVGVFTLFFSHHLAQRDGARVFAFEPSLEAFSRLQSNLTANGCSKVVAFNAAVSSTDGTASFFEPRGHLTNGSLRSEFASNFSATVQETRVTTIGPTTIQEMVASHPRLLIKVDVEGAEPEIMLALTPIWDVDHPPHLIIEVLEGVDAALNAPPGLLERYEAFELTADGAVLRPRLTAGIGRDYYLRPRVH
jgi:FkbM family methyltransferase